MQLTFASYNIHKAVGMDRRRDPDRILAVLREIDADIVALQEVDRRFGERASVLPRSSIEERTAYGIVPLATSAEGIGWHGNALLARRGVDVLSAQRIALPTVEPRGAVCAELALGGQCFRVVGMHLDLSGLRRRHQLRTVLTHLAAAERSHPSVLMGDFNEWSPRGGAVREFIAPWQVLAPGRSFPARRPLAPLDRIVVSAGWRVLELGVHHSPLASKASDHLPVIARLELTNRQPGEA